MGLVHRRTFVAASAASMVMPNLANAQTPTASMDDLEGVISVPALLPQGIEVRRLGAREYAFRQPGWTREVRISTDPAYYEQNADTVELWSPGNPTFPPSEVGPEPVQVERLA